MGLGSHENDRLRILLGARYSRSDSPAACLSVGVVVITRDEDDYGIRVTLQYMKECQGNRNTSTAIQGLRDDTRVVYAP
jgi:hypothetical protein